MRITEIIKRKKTFSLEFFPPKTEKGLEELVLTVKTLSAFNPDFISVTDSGYGIAKGKSIALSQIIKEKTGIEIMPHLTCINNTPEEIANILEKISERGIENILALRGDRANYPVFETYFNYASELIKEIKKRKDLCIGVAGYPEKHPEALSWNEDIKNLKRKIEAGGEFIITQLFFNNTIFFKYLDMLSKAGINKPVIPGIMPIRSRNSVEQIIKKTKKISIPKELIRILENDRLSDEDFHSYVTEFTIQQCEELFKNGIHAIHFFTFNNSKSVVRILKALKNA